jgi:glycosyltransferase involved in cell wall biosynthesis
MTSPKVSILIPTFNRSRYVSEAIESALSQDYENLEVIVSDNASEDDTPQVASTYVSDRRFRYFRNVANIGIGGNFRKLVFEHATGEYGKLLLDDDYLIDKNHISRAVCILAQNGLDIVYSDPVIRIDDPTDGSVSYRTPESLGLPQSVPVGWWMDHVGSSRCPRYPNLASGSVFRLRKARELDAFRHPIYGLDYELSLKFMLSGCVGYISNPQYVERLHRGNDGRAAVFQERYEGARLFERVYEYGLAIGHAEKRMKRFKRRTLKIFIETFLVRGWWRQNPVTVRGLIRFWMRIAELDPAVAWSVVFSRRMAAEMMFFRNKLLYSVVRRLYWIVRLGKWRPEPLVRAKLIERA